MNSQVAGHQRQANADFVIDNNGEVAALETPADAALAWVRPLPDAVAVKQAPLHTYLRSPR